MRELAKVQFVYEQSSKRMYRFQEIPRAGKPKIIGTLYVEQSQVDKDLPLLLVLYQPEKEEAPE